MSHPGHIILRNVAGDDDSDCTAHWNVPADMEHLEVAKRVTAIRQLQERICAIMRGESLN